MVSYEDEFVLDGTASIYEDAVYFYWPSSMLFSLYGSFVWVFFVVQAKQIAVQYGQQGSLHSIHCSGRRNKLRLYSQINFTR